MDLNWLRHPTRAVQQARRSLAEDTLNANLRYARDHAARGNYEGFYRHCGHAKDIARHHFPERLPEVKQVEVKGVDASA